MMSALAEACESWLQHKLNLAPDMLSLRADAKPPPTAGDLFIAVYGVSSTPMDPDLNRGIDIGFDIGITVTKRTRYNPYDFQSRQALTSDTNEVAMWLWKCVGWLHQEHDIPYNATALVRKSYASADAFIEPLRFKDIDSVPSFVDEGWFRPDMSADAAYRKATYPYAGMVMDCVLGDCRRIMTIANLREEVRLS